MLEFGFVTTSLHHEIRFIYGLVFWNLIILLLAHIMELGILIGLSNEFYYLIIAYDINPCLEPFWRRNKAIHC